jgi:hypothetical protein
VEARGGNAAEMHPEQPAEVWVEKHQLDEARTFLP